MKNIWRKYKTGIIFTGYVAASFLLVWLVFLPYKNRVESQADKIQEKELDNQIFERKTSKINQMEEKYNEYQNNKEKMGKFLKNGEEVDLIKKIESLGEETKNTVSLKVLDADIQNTKNSSVKSDKNKIKEESILKDISPDNFLSLEISLEGDYFSFINFLEKIENLDYYADVISLNLTKTIIENKNYSSDNIFSSNQDSSPEKNEKKILKGVIDIIVYKN